MLLLLIWCNGVKGFLPFCPCRVSLRVTRRQRPSVPCSSAVRTSSSMPPGLSVTQKTSTSIYSSAKHPPSELPTPSPPLPTPTPNYRPERETRGYFAAGFISLKKLQETRRQSQELNSVLETQTLFTLTSKILFRQTRNVVLSPFCPSADDPSVSQHASFKSRKHLDPRNDRQPC